MADVPIRRASLTHDERPATTPFLQCLISALGRLNWTACTSKVCIEEAERLLALSNQELEDLGLQRGDIHAYIFERPEQD
ncbi:MAG: hypothetical protein AAF557_06245 [Pseudomonadota bacterium]